MTTIETRRDLREDPGCWGERYPDLPGVQVARQDGDPLLWIRADSPPHLSAGETLFVAGYSLGDLVGPFVTVGEFMRGGSARFYGLAVEHENRKLGWTEFDAEILDFEGPGSILLLIDESWQPRRFSEVVRDYPGYEFIEHFDWPTRWYEESL